jgi:hypothetical protein
MSSPVSRPRPRLSLALLGCVALFGASCVERSQAVDEEIPVHDLIAREAPSPAHRLAIRFEDKVELVGYDVAPAEPAPGERVTITWHWKTLRAIDSGFRLFTHVDDGRGGAVTNLDAAGPLRRGYTPDRWRAGEFLRDPQTLTVPADFAAAALVFHVGFWNGPRRMEVAGGPNDGRGRARAATVRVRGRAATPEVPDATAKRADRITLDGRLDEAAWAAAEPTVRFVETMRGTRAPFAAIARFAYDDRFLYVAYEVEDERLLASHESHDDHLWEQDCVELFLDPAGAGRGYVEMQVSPRGVTFDTRYDSRRVPRPFGHVDFESGIEARVTTRGTVDDDEDDEGYVVEARIPFASLGVAPARAGTTYRLNMYVMNKLARGMTAAAWSPPLVGDFHVPPRFGRLSFR